MKKLMTMVALATLMASPALAASRTHARAGSNGALAAEPARLRAIDQFAAYGYGDAQRQWVEGQGETLGNPENSPAPTPER